MTWFIGWSVYRPTPALTARRILEILHWRTDLHPTGLPAPPRAPWLSAVR